MMNTGKFYYYQVRKMFNPIFDAPDAVLKRDFPVQVPPYFNFARDVIDRWARYDRNKLALIWTNQQKEERKYTFRDLSRLSNRLAHVLQACGIRKGDRVFLQLPRLPEWWIYSLAMIKIGAIQCPSPVLLTPADIRYRINAGKFKMVITDHENAPKFDEVLDECPTLQHRLLIDGARPDWINGQKMLEETTSAQAQNPPECDPTPSTDPLLMIFTSGTSKHPKMVEHAHSYPIGHRVTAEWWHGLQENDVTMAISDTGWAKNLWGNYFGQWIAGACILVFDVRGKFQAHELLPVLEHYGVSDFCAPPTVYRMLLLHDLSKYDFSELRSCVSAGEPLHTESIQSWKEGTGVTIREAYGQTETVAVLCNRAGEMVKPGSMGKPTPGWQVELHDEDGHPVPQGEDGRVAVRIAEGAPAGLMTGYVNCPGENEKYFINGYFYTGDRAYCDPDGYYWYLGRSDDIIKSSGYRISPSEVEDVMAHHAAVLEVAVIGIPDPLRGTRIKAFVVSKPGTVESEELVRDLQQYVKKLTAPYKYPREIEFLPRMPKTISGKIRREALRKYSEDHIMGW